MQQKSHWHLCDGISVRIHMGSKARIEYSKKKIDKLWVDMSCISCDSMTTGILYDVSNGRGIC